MMHNLPMASLVRSAALTVTGSSGRRAVVERRHAVAKGAYSSTRLIGMPRRVTVRARRHHPWVMVWTMAVAQVISWGTLFYAFSLFVVPMHESLGWSRPLLNGALSLGLLGTGVVGFPSEPGLTVTVAEVS